MSQPDTPDDATRVRPKPTTTTTVAKALATGTWATGNRQTSSATVNRVGRFEVRRLLGEGAFAFVYLAFDPELEREVALKVPKAEGMTPEASEVFLRENRLAAIIQHPNICPVYEVGTDGGVPYIVMRVVPNTLAGLLKRLNGALPPRAAVAIVRKLALGLVAAHTQKVIHRDIKPANILYDDVHREVMIADFGLARFADQATAASDGVPKGTPAYMSPEQARGKTDEIGPASDIYSLGVILYELLVGRVPFTGTVWEVMRDHCETPPAAPSAVRPGLSPQLDVIVLKAMAKNPKDRHPTAKALAAALADALREGVSNESLPGPGYDATPAPAPSTRRGLATDENATDLGDWLARRSAGQTAAEREEWLTVAGGLRLSALGSLLCAMSLLFVFVAGAAVADKAFTPYAPAILGFGLVAGLGLMGAGRRMTGSNLPDPSARELTRFGGLLTLLASALIVVALFAFLRTAAATRASLTAAQWSRLSEEPTRYSLEQQAREWGRVASRVAWCGAILLFVGEIAFARCLTLLDEHARRIPSTLGWLVSRGVLWAATLAVLLWSTTFLTNGHEWSNVRWGDYLTEALTGTRSWFDGSAAAFPAWTKRLDGNVFLGGLLLSILTLPLASFLLTALVTNRTARAFRRRTG